MRLLTSLIFFLCLISTLAYIGKVNNLVLLSGMVLGPIDCQDASAALVTCYNYCGGQMAVLYSADAKNCWVHNITQLEGIGQDFHYTVFLDVPLVFGYL